MEVKKGSNKKSLVLRRNSALNVDDSEFKTYGCRHSNSEICGSNAMSNVCAFVRKDRICRRPPRSWKKLFMELKKERR